MTRKVSERAKAAMRAAAKARRLERIRDRHQVMLRRQQIAERIRMEGLMAELDRLFDEP